MTLQSIEEHPGDYKCFRRGCELPQCLEDMQRYRREWQRRYRRGESDKLVDAAPARDHLIWLASKNIPLSESSRVTGLSIIGLSKIRRGSTKRIMASNLNKILNIIPNYNAKPNLVNGPTKHAAELGFPVIPSGVVPGTPRWRQLMKEHAKLKKEEQVA